MQETKKNFFVLCIAGLVSIGGILYGYDMGVISGALLFIKNTIPMNDTEVGMIVGAVLGGGLIGTLIAGPVSDRFGRRILILASSVIFIFGVSAILLANSFLMLLLARLLLGMGVGVVAVAVPLYVAEIVPSKDRGKYVTFFQLLLTFGIVAAYFVDLLFTSSGNWRAMFAVLLIPSFILFFGMFFLPETPRWLIANDQLATAKQVLRRIRQSEREVESDVKEIQTSLLEIRKETWGELFSHELLLPSLIAIAIAIFNQLTGINSFLQYAPLILKNAGISSNFVSMLGSAGIGVLNFLFTIIAITLIDTLGRRPLLLLGVGGVVLSELFLGAVNYFIPNSPNAGILSLIGLLFYIMFFAVGPGVVVWLAISELFPTQVRGKGIAVCLFFNSLASTLLATFFLPLVKHLGVAQTYWLFAFFSTLYFLVTYFFLPETKARSLEEIQHYFFKKHRRVLSSRT
ncbi:MAG: sugar porter family MFS transporter [Gammaproteobacteria bacterium]